MEKLLAMLCDKTLHLTRIDRFRDPWEGVLTDSFINSLKVHQLAAPLSEIVRRMRDFKYATFVNCWHENASESAALWDLYSGKAGVAVRSNVEKLKTSIATDVRFGIGRVTYADHRTVRKPGPLSMLEAPLLKRKCFEHEREVRVIIQSFPETKDVANGRDFDWTKAKESLEIEVDLSVMIDSIFISPIAPKWLLRHVRELLNRFGLSEIEIIQSDLYAQIAYGPLSPGVETAHSPAPP